MYRNLLMASSDEYLLLRINKHVTSFLLFFITTRWEKVRIMA